MSDPQRYVVVDDASKTIVEGPYLWDGVTDWALGTDPDLMLESDALGSGYAYPPPPPRRPRP